MASVTEIANAALIKVGAKMISSIDDDTESARLLSARWNMVRDAELRARNWRFAVKRASLAALETEPAFGFDNEFELPSDCLRVIMVGDEYPGISATDYRSGPDQTYQIEGGKILINGDDELNLRYVARIENTGLWDALFSEVFACRLALELVERLSDSGTKQQLLAERYRIAMQMAIRGNAVESPAEPLPDNTWVLSRL